MYHQRRSYLEIHYREGTIDVDSPRDGVLDRGSIPLTSTMLAWLNGRAADL